VHVQKRNCSFDLEKFCLLIDTLDVIACANFGDNWLSGLRVAGSHIQPSSLTLIVVLTRLGTTVTMCDEAQGFRYNNTCPPFIHFCI